MKSRVIVDTGPLVALLNQKDHSHAWVVQQLQDVQPPMVTCESVLAEATYLTRQNARRARRADRNGGRKFFDHRHGGGRPSQRLACDGAALRPRPMSLADACLVRLAELFPQSPVLTLESDFSVYRKNGRQVIEVLRP